MLTKADYYDRKALGVCVRCKDETDGKTHCKRCRKYFKMTQEIASLRREVAHLRQQIRDSKHILTT